MSLKYEPFSEPLRISAKYLFLHQWQDIIGKCSSRSTASASKALTVLFVALTVLLVALTVLHVAMTVLHVALAVLHVALTVSMALTVLHVALAVLRVALAVLLALTVLQVGEDVVFDTVVQLALNGICCIRGDDGRLYLPLLLPLSLSIYR